MPSALSQYFCHYPATQAPFLHQQFQAWQQTRPLAGLKVINHIPLVTNTLLKIACLSAAGATVTATNPHFLDAHPLAVRALQEDGIRYVADLNDLRGETFDLYLDCGAELYQTLGSPKLGAVEITRSGDLYYQTQSLGFPVISVDRSLTKQLETLFGPATNTVLAISKLTGLSVNTLTKKSWLVFGFGKIGRGVCYYCIKNKIPITIIDQNPHACSAAEKLGIAAVDLHDTQTLQSALSQADIVITATGIQAALQNIPKSWLAGKILANLGVLDEFGTNFTEEEVLNAKKPINFVLEDPTPMFAMDPEMYAHNLAALEIIHHSLSNGLSPLPSHIDQDIIQRWCNFHSISKQELQTWILTPLDSKFPQQLQDLSHLG